MIEFLILNANNGTFSKRESVLGILSPEAVSYLDTYNATDSFQRNVLSITSDPGT